ncbi:Rho GTPase activation protein [Obelidium mucronatum]|nr:Rho GTPase activation protein [Obelidium mucronatum]
MLDRLVSKGSQDRLAALDLELTLDGANGDERVPLVRAHERSKQYGALFYHLQSNPTYLVLLLSTMHLSDIDPLLDVIMFTIYGSQYDSREEHLLLSMLQTALAQHFTASEETANLLRANSPVSRMLTTYARRAKARTYLRSTMSKLISAIVDSGDLDLEINPLKLDSESVDGGSIGGGNSSGGEETGDEGSSGGGSNGFRSRSGSRKSSLSSTRKSFQFLKSNSAQKAAKKTQDMLDERTAILADIVRGFLDTLIGSIDEVPFGIRWICKQIRVLVKQKYPDSTDLNIASLIGGFFMLRFLNPAIVSPEEYTFTKAAKPSETTKRTLTLIAKVLQNLANKTTAIKEDYMTPLFPFIEAHKERVSQFFLDLCNVNDFDQVLKTEVYLERFHGQTELTIRFDQVFVVESLLIKNLDMIAPHPNDPVRGILLELAGDGGGVKSVDPAGETNRKRIRLDLVAPADLEEESVVVRAKASFCKILQYVSFREDDVFDGRGYFLDLQRLADLAVSLRAVNPIVGKEGVHALRLLADLKAQPSGASLLKKLSEDVTLELEGLQLVTRTFAEEYHVLESVLADAYEQEEMLRSRIQSSSEYLVNSKGEAVSIPASVTTAINNVDSVGASADQLSPQKPTIWNLFGLHRSTSQNQLQK